MPKISIIVPVYNAESTLQRCCNSLINQTYSDIEIILIDDGSTDGSLLICEEMAERDHRISIIYQENGGVSVARNRGLDAVAGDYLMFIDSDDWIETDTVRTMLDLVNSSDSDVGIFSFINHYAANKRYVFAIEDKKYTVKEVILNYRSIQNSDAVLCSVCNKLYKTDLINDFRVRFSDGIPFGEDFIFNSKVFQNAKSIVTTSKAFYYYDCSVENSGVKKLYTNYDKFINLMDEALTRLCLAEQIERDCFTDFRDQFVGARWLYAFGVCVFSNIELERKSRVILRWAQAIPDEIQKGATLQNSDYRIIMNLIDQGCHEKKIQQLIRQIIQENDKRKRITKMKIAIKRVLHI